MLLELRLAHWLQTGLALYRANPLLTELVVWDQSQHGTPTTLANGQLTDTLQQWLPGEYAGGQVRWGGTLFPIITNTPTMLTVQGDPSLVGDVDDIGYQILHPATAKLQELLDVSTFTIGSAFGQVPTQLPAFVLRLERETQGDAYWAQSPEHYVLTATGAEHAFNRTEIIGQYLISIFAVNRTSCLYLYGWLVNYWLRSQQQFASWGLENVSMQGSDIDPVVQYDPEKVFARHFLFTAQRTERALAITERDLITDLDLNITLEYAKIHITEGLL